MMMAVQHLSSSRSYLTGNPCAGFKGYRKYVISLLPQVRACMHVCVRELLLGSLLTPQPQLA